MSKVNASIHVIAAELRARLAANVNIKNVNRVAPNSKL
jgi:hypothetical protein